MERVMHGETPRSAVAAAAAEWDLGVRRHAEIAAMVDALAASSIVTHPSRKLAEFPVLFRSPEDGALVEGKIDLLAEGPDGWTVVDYKTDRIDQFRGDESAIRSHFETYAPQLSEYARGLMLLGVRVVGLRVLSARNGKPYDLPLPP
jgi:ATP-dependent exoDNAse (exonuclease V) beta subunit